MPTEKRLSAPSRRGYRSRPLPEEKNENKVLQPVIELVAQKPIRASDIVDAKKEIMIGKLPLFKATEFIQRLFAEDKSWNIQDDSDGTWSLVQDRLKKYDIKTSSMSRLEQVLYVRNKLTSDAMAGDYEASDALCVLVELQLKRYGVEVEGMTLSKAAYEVYKYAWGMDFLEELWRDPKINALHINAPDDVRCQVRSKNTRLDIKFKDEEHLRKVLHRLGLHDRAGVLNRSKPGAEFVRRDGSRITATHPPITSCITACFRKHDLSMTLQDMVRLGSLDERIIRILRVLISGRASVIITGGTGTGKTTLLRRLIEFYDPGLRIGTIEQSQEIYAKEVYPDRDIFELFEQADVEYDMRALFRKVLRYDPDIVITGEIRGAEEADESINSATRGMEGSLVTAHFNYPDEVLPGIADILKGGGVDLPFERLLMKTATAYNINIHMRSDHSIGKTILQSITEYTPNQRVGTIEYNEILRWVPSRNDYFAGEWQVRGKPSQRLIDKLVEYRADQQEMEGLGWL